MKVQEVRADPQVLVLGSLINLVPSSNNRASLHSTVVDQINLETCYTSPVIHSHTQQ